MIPWLCSFLKVIVDWVKKYSTTAIRPHQIRGGWQAGFLAWKQSSTVTLCNFNQEVTPLIISQRVSDSSWALNWFSEIKFCHRWSYEIAPVRCRLNSSLPKWVLTCCTTILSRRASHQFGMKPILATCCKRAVTPDARPVMLRSPSVEKPVVTSLQDEHRACEAIPVISNINFLVY